MKDNNKIYNQEIVEKIVNASDDNSHSITHAVRYTPDESKQFYRSEHYKVECTSDGVSKISEYSENRPTVTIKKTRSFVSSFSWLKIAGIMLLCVVLSFVSGFVAAYLGDFYFQASDLASNHKGNEVPRNPSRENIIYFDSGKEVIEQEILISGTLMSMEDAISAVKDTVVEITTETVNNGFGGYSQYVVSGAGSGVIVSTGGYIITNYHVIDGATNIVVRLTDGREYSAEIIGVDSKTDIAVIAINSESANGLDSAVIGVSSNLSLGQKVIAIGNPLGQLGGTVTDGIISSLERQVAVEGSGSMSLLQTNAAVNPGNSGGGLFDLYGRLVGIVNAKTSGEGIEGISFAIPIDTAWDVACQLIEKGYVSGRPSLGLSLKLVHYGASYFGDVYTQVVVSRDHNEYGLKANDIIISVNGVEITDLNDVNESISTNDIGDSVVVRIKRDRKYYELKINLVEYVPTLSETEITN